MSTLDIGYLVGVGPCALTALCLPLVWWKPMFGLPLFYLMMLGFVCSAILMSGVIP